MMRCLVAVPFALLLFPAPADAQICRGRVSFEDQPVQMTFGGTFPGDGIRVFDVGVAGGGPVGFGGAGIALGDSDFLNGTTIGVGGFGGGEVRAGDRVRLCPMGSASIAFLPEQDLFFATADARVLAVAGGVSVGILAAETDVAQIIPTLGFSIGYTRLSGTIESDGLPLLGIPSLSESDSIDDVGVAANFGVGVVLSRLVSITPLVTVAFADESVIAFSISASIGFR